MLKIRDRAIIGLAKPSSLWQIIATQEIVQHHCLSKTSSKAQATPPRSIESLPKLIKTARTPSRIKSALLSRRLSQVEAMLSLPLGMKATGGKAYPSTTTATSNNAWMPWTIISAHPPPSNCWWRNPQSLEPKPSTPLPLPPLVTCINSNNKRSLVPTLCRRRKSSSSLSSSRRRSSRSSLLRMRIPWCRHSPTRTSWALLSLKRSRSRSKGLWRSQALSSSRPNISVWNRSGMRAARMLWAPWSSGKGYICLQMWTVRMSLARGRRISFCRREGSRNRRKRCLCAFSLTMNRRLLRT